MQRIAGLRPWKRLFGAAIGIALAIGASGPAFAVYAASSQLCYGARCSEMGYEVYVPFVSDTFHDDVNGSVPDQTGNFDETSRADASARVVSFEVSFMGGELPSDVFLGSTPQRPRGSLTLIAFMGATGEDELTITAPGLASGYVTLDASLEAGGINGCTSPAGCSVGLPFVSPYLDVQFFTQADQGGSGDYVDVDKLTTVGGYSQHYTSDPVRFTAGTPFPVRIGISGTMSLSDLFTDPSPPNMFDSGSSLAARATIDQLHVFDADHQPIADATIVSATGTDWTTTVPEPADVASALAAALALVALMLGRSGA